MKRIAFYLIFILSTSYVTSCSRPIQHADPFYNVNHDDYPLIHLPLINPVEAKREVGESPWRVFLPFGMFVSIPDEQDNVFYPYDIEELEKFAVENGIIMAYSEYVDTEADAYIRDNYYHWFVLIPNQEIADGFHTEAEFLEYIQTLGIQDPDWQTPDEAYKQYKRTGCLAWFPDCDGME
jgi:hypothetical protein